jgi:hypothetical protein
MSYASIARCAGDPEFQPRVEAAYAKEGGINPPDPAYYQQRWAIAGDPSIEAPYESALAGNNPHPGTDESVISDGMLLAAVTAHPYNPPPGA